MEQIENFVKILEKILNDSKSSFTPKARLEILKNTVKIYNDLRKSRMLMKVKGKDWMTKTDLDNAYHFFKM